MGLFSKKTTYRDFSFSRVIDDEYLPDVIGQAITKYTLDKDNQESLTDLMLQYGWKSNAVKWNAAYRYARKPGKYTYGLPVSGMISETNFTGAESLDTVLKTLTGASSISYVYSKFGENNFRHSMWQLLVSNYGYAPLTNEMVILSNQVGKKVYLANAINYLTNATQQFADPQSLEHWGIVPQAGFTPTRPANPNAADTPDRTSMSNSNYVDIDYEFLANGVVATKSVATKTVTTTVRTPNGSGGYNDVTTTDKSDTTTNNVNYNGATIPPTVTGFTKQNESTSTNTVPGTPTTTSTTNPTTGVITVVTTQTDTVNTVNTYDAVYSGTFNMGFGQYDFEPDSANIDTDTVLDDDDAGNYDPNAVLDPSGESDTDTSDWFQVLYSYTVNGTSRLAYFTYNYGSGAYPSLDGITDTTVADFNQHFPRIYFRLNGNKLIDDNDFNTDAYKTSVRFAKKLDMDYQGVGEEVYNALSSLDKVRDVCLMQCIPANTSDKLEIEYLYKYFTTYYGIRPVYNFANAPVIWVQQSTGTPVRPVTDYDTYNAHAGAVTSSIDKGVSFSMGVDAVGSRLTTGSIGPIGTFTSSNGTGAKLVIYKQGYTNDNGSAAVSTTYGTQPIQYISYKFQETATQYRELRVYGLTTGAKVGGKYVYKSGTNEFNMVMLDHAFRKEFSPHEAETLYARATHIFIGTEYTIKSKWYQTGLFKAVVVVIAVVLSWWTAGASMSLVAVVTAAATAIGAMVIMSLLSKYVFSKLGGWFAVLAVVVAVIAIAYGGYLYLTSTVGPYSITALQMITVSNVAMQAANANLAGQIERYQRQIDNLNQTIEDKQKDLDTANDELRNPYNTITDSIFASVSKGYIIMGETPGQMLARTLDTNVGIAALDLANMYLTRGTSLPSSIEIIQQMVQNIYKPSELDQTFEI